MLKKNITYDDLDGNPVTGDFWFHLSKADLAEFAMTQDEGFGEWIQQLSEASKANDRAKAIEIFKKILRASYGEKSADGKSFLKSAERTEWFVGTNAYSELFIELVTGDAAAAEFIAGVIPSGLDASLPETKDERPAWIREDREPTSKELQGMSKEQMQEAFRRRAQRSDQSE